VSTTGIADLTLGGGIAWLTGKHRMAIDNLLSAEVVLGSGEVVTASEDAEPDLFWALRGGGGNFGVVTSFGYRAHPLASVLAGVVLHPLEAAPQPFSFYRESPPTYRTSFLPRPPSCTRPTDRERSCAESRSATRATTPTEPRPTSARCASSAHLPPTWCSAWPYPARNTGADWLFHEGALSYWKSAFFSELLDQAVEVMTDAFERAPSELCALGVEDFHGAVTRVAPTATAYPHREPGYNLLLISQWTDPAQTDTGIA
jgi:hypothetical protein